MSGWGIDAAIPAGWDARLYRRVPGDAMEQTFPVLHAANFPLPANRGDFGSGAVEVMGPTHLFVSLLEYGDASVSTPLFAKYGMPKRLSPQDFRPDQLQRPIPGQLGVQRFFTDSGRAFCLYAVLGSYAARLMLIGRLNAALAGITLTAIGGVG